MARENQRQKIEIADIFRRFEAYYNQKHYLSVEKKKVFICSVCGYTHEGEPPDKCPVCSAAKKAFNEIL